MHTIFWLEKLKGRDHWKDLGVYGKIILKWILGKQDGKLWAGGILFRIETIGWILKGGKLFDKLSEY
jgi:hypothetical protein